MTTLKSNNSQPHPLHAIPPCLLLFFSGSIFSLGVFTVPIEQASNHASLVGVWPSSMGLMHFLSAPVMMLAGVYLHHPVQQKTYRIRTLSLLSSLTFSALAFAAVATKHSLPCLLRLSVTLQCFPLGINYLLLIETLIALFPNVRGFIVGCALVSYSLGDIFLSWAFTRLVISVGVISALYISAFTLSVPSIILSMILVWPSSPQRTDLDDTDNVQQPLLPTVTYVKLPWSTLWKLYMFWLYILIVFTGGAAYAFTPFFFKLVHVFGRSASLGVTIYQVVGVGGTVAGLLASWATDVLHFGNGYFRSGAKNVSILAMSVQMALFAALVPLSQQSFFWASMLVLGTLVVLTSCHYGVSVVLARDLFGEVNGGLVFGIGAGLALGTGEGVSAWIMSLVEQVVLGEDGEAVPKSYVLFYKIGVVWSFIGLASALVVSECEQAIDKQKRSIRIAQIG